MGVAGGNSDSMVDNDEVGSLRTLNHTNIGAMATTMIGIIVDCASFMSETAAPTALNIAPYITTART